MEASKEDNSLEQLDFVHGDRFLDLLTHLLEQKHSAVSLFIHLLLRLRTPLYLQLLLLLEVLQPLAVTLLEVESVALVILEPQPVALEAEPVALEAETLSLVKLEDGLLLEAQPAELAALGGWLLLPLKLGGAGLEERTVEGCSSAVGVVASSSEVSRMSPPVLEHVGAAADTDGEKQIEFFIDNIGFTIFRFNKLTRYNKSNSLLKK